jgi:hypothetical protein
LVFRRFDWRRERCIDRRQSTGASAGQKYESSGKPSVRHRQASHISGRPKLTTILKAFVNQIRALGIMMFGASIDDWRFNRLLIHSAG